MDALRQQIGISLRLHYRNRMALLYSYLFPLIFLMAFWVLYRHESVTLSRHMGELLTVGILGGACFGLPTTMVSERERGVWRRYRLTPVSTPTLVGSTVLARYVILMSAGLLQIALALALGMPMPHHPFQLWIAFTFVSFAFVGLGLVMAMMADNVPAVQALGQCIFLPMLIIGGIAVPLAALPDWAQHISAFFPGRYAVEALQATVNGAGLRAAGFDLVALTLIGGAGCAAGAMMFRWDAQQRFAAGRRKGWVFVALAAWAAVGVLAEARGRIAATPDQRSLSQAGPVPSIVERSAPAPGSAVATPTIPAPPSGLASAGRPSSAAPSVTTAAPVPGASASARPSPSVSAPPREKKPAAATPEPPARPEPAASVASWRSVTIADINRDLVFDRLPSDRGVVAPIAPANEEPPPDVADELGAIRAELPTWKPAQVSDPVQRVRNVLYVAAVPDVLQVPLERYAALAVFERLQQDLPKDDLIKVLYWIALHPMDGDDSAATSLQDLGLDYRPADMEQTRERAAIYAVKLLGRLTGNIRAM